MPTSTNLRTRILPVENGRERLGWVAIDSTVCGRARGGLRLVADLESDEVSDAARCMTLKYGLLGLPQGGAKAGVRGDPDAPRAERRARLLEFGRAIEPLLRARSYVPDADLGTDASDIRWMAESLGLRVGAREWRASHSGVWTAHSVLAAMRAGLRRSGRELRGATVAIEGFGAVGSALAGLAHAAGARVVAVSTSRGALFDARGLDVPSLVAIARDAGSRVVEAYERAERLPRERIFAVPADVVSPCARRHGIHDGNAGAVEAAVVAPGANDAVGGGAESALAARGVLCIPDFVANCGGVLGGTMAFAGMDEARVRRFLDVRIDAMVEALVARAEREGVPVRALAERLALERFARARAAAERPTLRGRLFGVGLAAHRHGWLPAWASGALAPSYFERSVRL
ncbi:MAG TPA: Glu/Leu/Phe/Val dehydrogenase dimerization domain-containing protein [Candidatus Binatia bacterium]|nr:Glu/Leu/Phe/Val dehydrogenase dimerization domain-containing protein [Candidatus Binatia bacterium]